MPCTLIPVTKIIDDSGLGGCIQSRERFVEQKGTWLSDQGSGQRHSLAFSTGDSRWQLQPQVVDAELLQHRSNSLFPGGSRQMRQAIGDILFNRQMRKQGEVLQNIANATFGDGHSDRNVAVE